MIEIINLSHHMVHRKNGMTEWWSRWTTINCSLDCCIQSIESSLLPEKIIILFPTVWLTDSMQEALKLLVSSFHSIILKCSNHHSLFIVLACLIVVYSHQSFLFGNNNNTIQFLTVILISEKEIIMRIGCLVVALWWSTEHQHQFCCCCHSIAGCTS